MSEAEAPIRFIGVADSLAPGLKCEATASTKFHASGMLWWNAAFFADRCKLLEDQHKASFFTNGEWTPNDRILSEHRAFAVAAVMQSMSALEGGINEFYHELESGDSGSCKPIDAEIRKLLLHSWPLLDSDRPPPLEKYNWALETAGKEKVTDGKSPAQEFNDLRVVRNAIVHYRPEWSYESGEHAKLETRLSRKFAQSALMPVKTMSWFPNRCFGAGCAAWAVETAESFMREFCNRLGLKFWFEGMKYAPAALPSSA